MTYLIQLKFKNVKLSSFVSGRSDKFFSQPLEFKPERFIKDQSSENS